MSPSGLAMRHRVKGNFIDFRSIMDDGEVKRFSCEVVQHRQSCLTLPIAGEGGNGKWRELKKSRKTDFPTI